MNKRRRTISSGGPDEAMDDSLSEQSPNVSTRKRKRLNQVITPMTYFPSLFTEPLVIQPKMSQ